MKRIYLASLLIGLFLVSGVQTTKADAATAYPTGLKILVFYDSQDSYSTDYKGLVANYTAAGNTVTVVTETNWNFTVNDTTGYDALFVSVWGSDIFNETTNLQVQSIKTWFDLGSKLLWVGGESDFAGNWIANKTNPLLQALGTNLRFDAGAVGDSVSNDGDGSHRVVANVTGVNSTFVFAVTQGFKEMIFHGATPIYYDMAGVSKDLRNMTLPSTIDVVINTSRFAEAQDQDTSVGNDDYYKYINISAPDYHDINGSFPMLVVDWAAGSSDSVLVLSGERVFSDYKNMYGTIREKSRGLHQGSAVVDAIVNYYFVTMKGGAGVLVHNKYNTLTDTVTNTETETETETEAAITNTETETVITTAAGSVVTETTTETESPVNMIAVFFAISVTALYFRRRK